MESCYLKTTWINSKAIILSEVNQREKRKYMHSIYSWNYLKETHTQNQVHKYNTRLVVTKDGRWQVGEISEGGQKV